jgi:hypothetical protein
MEQRGQGIKKDGQRKGGCGRVQERIRGEVPTLKGNEENERIKLLNQDISYQ